jgi:hypothetical protein
MGKNVFPTSASVPFERVRLDERNVAVACETRPIQKREKKHFASAKITYHKAQTLAAPSISKGHTGIGERHDGREGCEPQG